MDSKLPLLLGVLIILFSAPTVWRVGVEAQPVQEIAYDDGSSDSYSNQDVGYHLAVRFSLPSGWTKAKLLKVRYSIHAIPFGVDPTFRAHVYDSDGVTELASLVVTPTDTGWFDVDLSALGITLTGDFYVTIEYLMSAQPPIDADTSGPDYRSYRGQPGSWTLLTDRDLMIRAVVRKPTAVVGGVILKPEGSFLIVPFILALVILASMLLALIIALKKAL